jgi:hypothetical protein
MHPPTPIRVCESKSARLVYDCAAFMGESQKAQRVFNSFETLAIGAYLRDVVAC